jgi:hypothetical protein
MASKFQTQHTNAFLHAPLPITLMLSTRYTQIYENLLLYPGIGTNVKVPIQAKMDIDDEDLNWFHFGSSQESKLDPPLVLDSIWDCLGINLNIVDDVGKTIPGWHCGYCLIPSNCGSSRFFKHRNASKALSHLTKGKDIVTCTSLRNIPANVVHALTALMYSKANRKHDMAVQKNNLNEEVEQQQDHVLPARIGR